MIIQNTFRDPRQVAKNYVNYTEFFNNKNQVQEGNAHLMWSLKVAAKYMQQNRDSALQYIGGLSSKKREKFYNEIKAEQTAQKSEIDGERVVRKIIVNGNDEKKCTLLPPSNGKGSIDVFFGHGCVTLDISNDFIKLDKNGIGELAKIANGKLEPSGVHA